MDELELNITVEEITNAIRNMKGGKTGPDYTNTDTNKNIQHI